MDMDFQKRIENAALGLSGIAEYVVIEQNGRSFAIFADGSYSEWIPAD